MPEIKVKVTSEGFEKANREVDKLDRNVDEAGSSVSGFTKTLLGVGAALGGMALLRSALRSVVEATKAAVAVASVQEAAVAQLNQTLRSTGRFSREYSQSLQEMASALQDVSTEGDETILRTEALLLTFTQIGANILPQATRAVLDMATAMGGDLQSAAIQVGKALNDPVIGVSALQRVGVTLSAQQKQQVKDFVAVNDVASAQRLILAELATEFGGQALAKARTFGGQLEQLANNFSDLEEEIGFTISKSDAFRDALNAANNVVRDAVRDTKAWREEAAAVEPIMRALIRTMTDFAIIGARFTEVVGLLPVLITGGADAAKTFIATLENAVDVLRDFRDQTEQAFQFRDVVHGLDDLAGPIKQRAQDLGELEDALKSLDDPNSALRQGGIGSENLDLTGIKDEIRTAKHELGVFFEEFERRGQDIPKDLEPIARELGFVGAAAKAAGSDLGELGKGAKEASGGIAFIDNQIQASVKEWENYRKAVISAVDAQVELVDQAHDMRLSVRPLEALAEEIERINKLAADPLTAGQITPEVRTDLIRKAATDIRNLGDTTNSTLEGIEQAVNSVGKNFEDTFVDALTGTETSVKDFVNAVIKDLARIAIHEGVTKPLFGGIVSAIGASQKQGQADRDIQAAEVLTNASSGVGDTWSSTAVETSWIDSGTRVEEAFTTAAGGARDAWAYVAGNVGSLWTSALTGIFLGGQEGGFSVGGLFKSIGFGALSGLASGLSGANFGGGSQTVTGANAAPATSSPQFGTGGATSASGPFSVGYRGLHGGVVPGPIGAPVLGIVHGGEEYSGVGKSFQRSETTTQVNAPVTINVQSPDPNAAARIVMAQMPLIEAHLTKSANRGAEFSRAVGRRR